MSNRPARGRRPELARWSQEAELTASDRDFGDLFGRSVAINGFTAVVGRLLPQELAYRVVYRGGVRVRALNRERARGATTTRAVATARHHSADRLRRIDSAGASERNDQPNALRPR
jgi:hypothetical protein